MLFRGNDLLNAELIKDFERLTKGLNFGPDFDRDIEKAAEDLSTAFSGRFGRSPNLDIVRSDERYELFLDLPGVDPDTVEITVDGRTLTVAANREFTVADGDQHVHAGRRHGAFHRSFELADDLDIEALSARSENGVLIITVPVVAAPEPRKIKITVETQTPDEP